MVEKDKYVVYGIDGSSSQARGHTAHRLMSILNSFPRDEVAHGLIRLTDPKEHLDYCDGTQNPKRTADIDKLLKRLEAADGIIFGTPTYWFNMSARMKNLLERLVVTEKNDKYTLEGIVAGFVATGDANEDGAMIALSNLSATLNHLGMITFPYSMIYFRGNGGPKWAIDDLKEFPRRMLTMMKFGRNRRASKREVGFCAANASRLAVVRRCSGSTSK
jgi:multimeric flavodoxin WrbA